MHKRILCPTDSKMNLDADLVKTKASNQRHAKII